MLASNCLCSELPGLLTAAIFYIIMKTFFNIRLNREMIHGRVNAQRIMISLHEPRYLLPEIAIKMDAIHCLGVGLGLTAWLKILRGTSERYCGELTYHLNLL